MRRILVFAAIFACNADTFTDDGGTDAEPDSIVVGGGDGSVVDAPGKDIVVGPAKHFCDFQDAQFCADFDIPGDAGAGFGPPNLQGGWLLTFQNQQTWDASPMAVSVVTAGDAAGAATIDNPNLAKSGTGPSTLMIVEADVYLGSTGFVPDPISVFRAGVSPDPQLTFGLAMHSNQWKLARRAGGSPVALTPQPSLNQWLHAVLVINITGGTVTLTVGGTSTAVLSGATGIDGGTTYPGYVAIGGDDQYFPNNTSVHSFVDNVTAHWQ